MDSAILFSWTRPAVGREAQAFEAFTASQTFFATKAHEGLCGEPMNFIGTSGLGMMMVPGDYEHLMSLTRLEEFREMYMKTVFAVPDISYEIGAFGEGVQDAMARWARVGGELALI